MRPQIVMLIPLGESPTEPPRWDTFPKPLPPGSGRPDQGLPGHGHPDQSLPMPPVDPSWGVTPPVDPGYGRPAWGPVDPGYGQGGGPVDPGYGNRPPVDPGYGRPAGLRPDNSLPLPPESTVPPGSIYPPVTQLHTKTAVLAWLPGYGARWIVLGPSATPTA